MGQRIHFDRPPGGSESSHVTQIRGLPGLIALTTDGDGNWGPWGENQIRGIFVPSNPGSARVNLSDDVAGKHIDLPQMESDLTALPATGRWDSRFPQDQVRSSAVEMPRAPLRSG